jgi:hypothetical protein
MQHRRWISIVALLGVLLHASVLVRHNAVMLGALLLHDTLVSDLRQMCHGGRAVTGDDGALPSVPRPSDAQNGCPICSGLASAFAIAAPVPAPLTRPIGRPIQGQISVAGLVGPILPLIPPARGPPSLA